MDDSTLAMNTPLDAPDVISPADVAPRPVFSFAEYLAWLEEYGALFGPPPQERAKITLAQARI